MISRDHHARSSRTAPNPRNHLGRPSDVALKNQHVMRTIWMGQNHPDNASAQRKRCNRRAFDVARYRANLIARIGLERVEALEQDNRTHKWTRDELREIRDTYRRKLRELRKARKE